MTAKKTAKGEKAIKAPVAGALRLALLCDQGCEPEAALEAKELTGRAARNGKGYVVLDGCTPDDVAALCYRSQAAARVLAFIAEGKIAEPDDLLQAEETILGFDYSPYLKHGGTFRATCERLGDHSFQAQEIELLLGGLLYEEKHYPVNLAKPDMTLFCAIDHDAYVIGIDLAGRDLAKREYRAFHTRRSLRASVAYAAVRAAGYTGKETLLDPFMAEGSLVIEAAVFGSGTSPQRFRKEFAFLAMPFAASREWTFPDSQPKKTNVTGFAPMVSMLKMTRANAKLAGVIDSFSLTKCEIEWLDTKLEKGSVDLIVTVPPQSGKSTPPKDVEKRQDDLFHQAKYALGKKGMVLLVTEKKAELLNPAERHGFSLLEEREAWMGEKKLLFLAFGKK